MLELSRSRSNVVKLDTRHLRWPVQHDLFEKVYAHALEECWRKVKLDFRRVEFITGAGLGKIVSLYRKLKEQNMRLALENTNEQVHEIFRVTGLTRLIDVRTE